MPRRVTGREDSAAGSVLATTAEVDGPLPQTHTTSRSELRSSRLADRPAPPSSSSRQRGPCCRPIRMPRSRLLVGSSGLQDEIVPVSAADDLHADGQPRP